MRALAIASALVLALQGARASDADAPGDAHARHHVKEAQVARTIATVAVPAVTLVRADGARVQLARELDDGRPVFLDFVYTTCSAICPVLSQAFAELQSRLGADAARVRLVSVSIDPEEDTPARLADYARRFSAGPQWEFFTGSVEASIAVQRAFGTYRGDKMSHAPVTFFRAAPGDPWVRLDGFASPDVLLSELHPQLVHK